jgi:hypothetical protein
MQASPGAAGNVEWTFRVAFATVESARIRAPLSGTVLGGLGLQVPIATRLRKSS